MKDQGDSGTHTESGSGNHSRRLCDVRSQRGKSDPGVSGEVAAWVLVERQFVTVTRECPHRLASSAVSAAWRRGGAASLPWGGPVTS